MMKTKHDPNMRPEELLAEYEQAVLAEDGIAVQIILGIILIQILKAVQK